MTRKERAITNLKQMCSDGRYLGSGSYVPLEVLEDFNLAIKALEQEPVYFPPCVDCNTKMNEIREAYDKMKNQTLEQEFVLDKIRAEIEQRPYGIANDSVIQGMKYERVDILKIIDKYKAETDET